MSLSQPKRDRNLYGPQSVIKALQKALEQSRSQGDIQREIDILDQIGDQYFKLDDTTQAIQSHEQALHLARQLADEGRIVRALFSLGTAYGRIGDQDKCLTYYEQFLERIEESSDTIPMKPMILRESGQIHFKKGDSRKAIHYYEMAIIEAHKNHDPREEYLAWRALGYLYYEIKDLPKCSVALKKSVEIYNKLKNSKNIIIQNRLWISSDSNRLTYWYSDGRLQQWHLPDGKQQALLQLNEVEAAVVDPDGHLVASYHNKTITIWQIPEGKKVQTFQTPYNIQHLYIWNGGKVLATANYYEYGARSSQSGYFPFLQFWDIETGKQIDSVDLPLPDIIRFTHFLPANNWQDIMVGLGYPTPYIFDRIRLYVCPLNQEPPISNGGYGFIHKYHDSYLTSQTFDPAANFLALGWENNFDNVQPVHKKGDRFAIHLFRKTRRFPITPLSILKGLLIFLISPLLLLLTRDLSVVIPVSMAPLRKTTWPKTFQAYLKRVFLGQLEFGKGKWLNGHTEKINWLAITADSKLLVSGSDDRTIRLWQLPKGREIKQFTEHDSPVTCGVLHPDGRLLATADATGQLIIWDLSQGTSYLQTQTYQTPITSLATTPDGQYLITICEESPRLWNWNAQPLLLQS
jgi:WD40 repeat protein